MKSRAIVITGLILIVVISSSFILRTSYFNSPNQPGITIDYEKYESDWHIVDSLVENGLPKSAIVKVDEIYKKAKKENNHPQFIKASLYRINLKSKFEEEFIEKSIEDINNEILIADFPAVNILYSVKAELYWRYYQANRYQLLNRNTISNVELKDIRTWDMRTLVKEVVKDYQASLENSQELQKINLLDYDVLLETKNGSKKFRPTLFDFLAHQAVDFFMHDEPSITQPANAFRFDKEEYFAPAFEFSKLNIVSHDSLSLKFYALQTLQSLIRFHLNDEEPTAMMDVNLKRLEFVKNNSIVQHKDSLYLAALLRIEDLTKIYPSSTEASYDIAREYERLGNSYQPLISEDNKWMLKKAIDKCDEAIARFEKSDGAHNCKVLKSQIERSRLHMSTEQVNLPGQPFLSFIKYRNTSKLYFRVVKINYLEQQELVQNFRRRKDLLFKYVTLPVKSSWEVDLPDDGDYQFHSIETKMSALPFGHYVVLASSSKDFDVENSTIAYQSIWISNISYISQKTNKEGYRFYILDRGSGHGLKNINGQLFFREHDYRNRENKIIKGKNYISDESGYFGIPADDLKNPRNSFYLKFSSDGDTLVTDEHYYHQRGLTDNDKPRIKTWFFTDRSIYRPGQTIYFKGIVIEKLDDNFKLQEKFKTKIEFIDANNQKITELDLVTNEYGSFHGSFVAPKGVLNGRMTIRSKTGASTVLIEEYKRPQFEVVFNPIEGSYKLNENIHITGKAIAFAGNDIENAEVKFRVKRKAVYPIPFRWYTSIAPSQSMEILFGKTTTDENGKFEIEFNAIPDYSVPSDLKATFHYEISANVTDINGETQSSSTIVNVGYTALLVNLELDEVIEKSEFKSFSIKTTNLNGESLFAKGTISIEKLREPDRFLRTKQWEMPDKYILKKEKYVQDFPYDNYDEKELQVSLKIAELEFNTEVDSVISIENIQEWENGRYKITVQTKDEYGENVELVKYFTLFDKKSKKAPVNEISWFHIIDNHCEPGESAKFIIGSSDRNVKVLYEIVLKNKVLSREWIKLNQNQKLIEIPITEEHRGGLSINILTVKHNRSYNHSFIVNVPFTNKDLDFEFVTFRDKLIPDQKEEWKVKIKGKNKDKVAAELLAGMYDASLDKFSEHQWYFNLYSQNRDQLSWTAYPSFMTGQFSISNPSVKDRLNLFYREYDQMNWFGFHSYGRPYLRGGRAEKGVFMEQQAMPGQMDEVTIDQDAEVSAANISNEEFNEGASDDILKKQDSFSGIQIRRDFRETAFFFPVLKTDTAGNIMINFTVPESLTQWKLLGLAHTKELDFGLFEKEIKTQKELMIVPNAPRFFRKGDKLTFSAKVVNMSDRGMVGTASLQFVDSRTNQDISKYLLGEIEGKSFTINEGLSQNLEWEISIPHDFDVISYRIMAKAGNFTDGEEKAIPVLSNRMLVTESIPLPLKGNETKSFKFEKLLNSESTSIKSHKLSLEFSSNPTWYAIQALPYVMESSYPSSDNIFRRYYANSIASYLVHSNPKIKQVFATWKNYSTDALLSNLEKNEELKSVILKETPWVMDAQNEKERKQRIALLFDLNKMSTELTASLQMLKQKQSPNGGWPWFKGMRENRNVTQNIVTGFGHLKQLEVVDNFDSETKQMIKKAIRYLDGEIRKDYNKLMERHPDQLDKNHLSRIHIQYLYCRSYFLKEYKISKSNQEAFNYYRDQAKKYWVDQNQYLKGMIALAMQWMGIKSLPYEIVASIEEHALYNDELGMYWRENTGGYYWYEAPIETQALMIEVFEEITRDDEAVEQMKIWLLKQKQTLDWKTPKATAEAVYALILSGSNWLNNDKLAIIEVGNETINPLQLEDTKVEAGTGYFKTSWAGSDVKSSMGNITITNENESIAWGAVYWQYFEDLDKITFHKTPLSIDKKLYLKKNSDVGPVLEPIEDDTKLKVGDKVKVRIEIRVDRNMEYVHMKDMRASTFEPINVLSGYRYQGGLGYYESTLDATTNFFFDYLPKGTYVFEYPLVVSQKGDFSNGITSIQCLYAPEYTSHSEGVRVVVE